MTPLEWLAAVPVAPAAAGTQTQIRTLSLEEVKRSWVLAGLDILLFATSSLIARQYARLTRKHMVELQWRYLEADTLIFRALFLQLLSISNACRAVGLLCDAFIRLVSKRRHPLAFRRAWRRWFDYFISSLPTLIWLSMLSVLLLYIMEIYNRTQLRRMPLLKPTVVFMNLLFYLLYTAIALLTLHLCGGPTGPTYEDFRRFVYFLLGCGHVMLLCGLARYGWGLARQLQRRKSVAKPIGTHGASIEPASRLTFLVVVLVGTEAVRTLNDLEYSIGGLPYEMHSGLSGVLFLAFVKLVLEWVPSAAILWAFRPDFPRRSAGSPGGAHFLVDPLRVPGEGVAKPLLHV